LARTADTFTESVIADDRLSRQTCCRPVLPPRDTANRLKGGRRCLTSTYRSRSVDYAASTSRGAGSHCAAVGRRGGGGPGYRPGHTRWSCAAGILARCPEDNPSGPCRWCPGDPPVQTGNLRVNPVIWDANVCHTYWYVYSGQGNVAQSIFEEDAPPPPPGLNFCPIPPWCP
jgi:hypothetical protein